MADWDINTKSVINVGDDDVAVNLVRDLFLNMSGEMSVDEWQRIWSDAGKGIVHTSLGRTTLVTPQLADKALRSCIENGHCVIEEERYLVWPIQKALASTPAARAAAALCRP